MLRWAPGAARACVLAALFLVPVVFLPLTLDQFNLVKLAIMWALGALGLGLWASWSTERRLWLPPARFLRATGAFVIVGALATALSGNPALSLIGLYQRYGGLLPLLLYVSIAMLVVGLFWEEPGRLDKIVGAVVAATPLVAAYVILQAKGADFVHWGVDADANLSIVARHRQYPVGTMGNSNFAGGFLGVAFPLVGYAVLRSRSGSLRLALVLLAGFDAAALLFTRSRGGLLAAVAGTLVLMLFSRPGRIRRSRRIMAGALFAVLGLGLVAALGGRLAGQERSVFSSGLLRSETLVSRTWYWRTAVELFAERPILGHGLDTFYAGFPRHRLPADGARLGLELADKPHNIFLEYGANAGILGLGAYLAVVAVTLVPAFRRVRRLEGSDRLLLAAFLGMAAAYLVQGLFSIDVPPLALLGWVALAAVAVLSDPGVLRARRQEEVVQRRSRRGVDVRRKRRAESQASRWPVHVALAVFTVAVSTLGIPSVRADLHARRATFATLLTPGSPRVTTEARRAIQLDPREAAYRAVAGEGAEARAGAAADPGVKQRLLLSAVSHHRRAVAMRPGHVYYMLNEARALTNLAAANPAYYTRADRAWSRLARFDRTNWEVRDLYSQMLNAWANAAGGDAALRRRTIRELETLVRMRPGHTGAWISIGKLYSVLGQPEKARPALQRALALEPENVEAKALLGT